MPVNHEGINKAAYKIKVLLQLNSEVDIKEVQQPYHISLSKTVYLKHTFIKGFVDLL